MALGQCRGNLFWGNICTSVSTGSQSSSVNSMQEVLDDSCSDMTMMHPQDYSSTLESSPHTKKVKFKGKRLNDDGREVASI